MPALDRFVLVSLAICLAAGGWLAWSYTQPSQDAEPFDRAEWLGAEAILGSSNDPGCVRGGMALDLLERDMLALKSVGEVAALLGEPSEKRGASDWSYALGQCSGFGWEQSELLITFASGGRVVRGRVQRTDAP